MSEYNEIDKIIVVEIKDLNSTIKSMNPKYELFNIEKHCDNYRQCEYLLHFKLHFQQSTWTDPRLLYASQQ